MPQLQLIIALGLAVYRVTRFLLEDTLIDAQRNWVHNAILGTTPSAWRDKLYELIDCPYCISVWLAAIAVALTDAWVSVPLPVATWLAVCGATMVVWRYVEREPQKQ